MDTTRSYLRMCREAMEIQAQWVAENGDWWHVGARDLFSAVLMVDKNSKYKWKDSERFYDLENDIGLFGIVWLPRQDQLQRMILRQSGESCMELLEKITFFSKQIEFEDSPTMEKLWLMYYMFITEGKIWKDGRWVKNNLKNINEHNVHSDYCLETKTK